MENIIKALSLELKQKEEARKEKEQEKARKNKRSSSSTGKSILTSVIGTAVTYFAKTIATQLARNLTKKSKK